MLCTGRGEGAGTRDRDSEYSNREAAASPRCRRACLPRRAPAAARPIARHESGGISVALPNTIRQDTPMSTRFTKLWLVKDFGETPIDQKEQILGLDLYNLNIRLDDRAEREGSASPSFDVSIMTRAPGRSHRVQSSMSEPPDRHAQAGRRDADLQGEGAPSRSSPASRTCPTTSPKLPRSSAPGAPATSCSGRCSRAKDGRIGARPCSRRSASPTIRGT